MDILQREILDSGQNCWFMAAAVDSPHVYLRFKGKVLQRWINGDNIGYYIHIQEVLEDYEIIRDHLHRSKQRVFNIISERGWVKPIDCFELAQDMKTFNTTFCNKYKDYSWYLPAVFVFTSEKELNDGLLKANTLLRGGIKKSLQVLNKRIVDIKQTMK